VYLRTVTKDSREQSHFERGIRTAVSDYKEKKITTTEQTGRGIDRTVFCRTTFVLGQNIASPTDIK